MVLSEILILAIAFLALGFTRVSAWLWHAVIFSITVVFMAASSPFWALLLLVWLPFALPFIRKPLLSKPLMGFFGRNIPEMSDTEREALEAGDVWFEAELFRGSPNWNLLHAYPQPKLSAEEQHFLDNEVETLCEILDDWSIVTSPEKDLPITVWSYLKQNGFFGLIIEKKYGGREFSALAHSAVVTKIASRSVAAAVTIMVPNSLGPAELLEVYGTETQKEYYLPRLANGDEIPCFALTGSDSGSDAATMNDYGIVCEQEFEGKPILGIKLSFDKRYITLAPVATLVGLAFRLYDPEKRLGDKEEIGITLCLMPASHPGVEIGRRHLPANTHFMNGPIRGKDVFIPLDWVIGGANYVGQGWKMLMNCLSTGRAISLPANAVAGAQLCYRMTGAYAMLRKQFNVPIAKFEGIEEKLARIAGFNYIMLACTEMTAGAVDLGIKPSLVSAIAKYHTTEMCRTVTNDAMDVHGGRAIQYGPSNYLTGAYNAIPICITVEGANILTRNLLIFGQGLMRCHPYLLNEMEFAHAGKESEFDSTLVSHIGYTVSNFVRSFLLGLTKSAFVRSSEPKSVAKFYRRLTRMSSALAFASDIAILYFGGQLKRKERISARLGDVLSHLYLASCVLKRFKDSAYPQDELPYVKWSCRYSLYQIQTAFIDVIDNFPNRFIRIMLSFIIFPLGRCTKKPTDHLERQLLKSMLAPTALRDKLTKNVYVGRSMTDPMGKVDLAFEMWKDMDALDMKFSSAVKSGEIARTCDFESQLVLAVNQSILTRDEADRYRTFVEMRNDVIAVDEFDSNLFKKERRNEEDRYSEGT